MENKLLRKHHLPTCAAIDTFQFDIAKLQDELDSLKSEFVSVYESNKSFCANNHQLAEQVYEHFEQISLTVFNDEDAIPSQEECESLGKDPTQGSQELSKHALYRFKLSGKVPPAMNERNYTKPTETYVGSYFQECIEQFKAKPNRVRLVRLQPGQVLPAHIDYDPSHAVRVLIPIYTNNKCINMFWRKGQPESYFIPANGVPYFLNTGFAHGAANFGTEDRFTLMVSLEGQEDIEHLAL